jgi:hypothetical protein
MRGLEKVLKKEINYTLYSREEFKKKRGKKTVLSLTF